MEGESFLRDVASIVLPLWHCCITSREAKPLRAFWSDRFRLFGNKSPMADRDRVPRDPETLRDGPMVGGAKTPSGWARGWASGSCGVASARHGAERAASGSMGLSGMAGRRQAGSLSIFFGGKFRRWAGRDLPSPVPETFAMVDGRMVDGHADGRG